MAWVYILECADRSLYTGATLRLERRLKQHETGRGAKYTRSRLPVKLVHAEWVADWSDALSIEAGIKRMPIDLKRALVLLGRESFDSWFLQRSAFKGKTLAEVFSERESEL